MFLEWTNGGCPYVQKHYNSGNMQGLQKGAAKDGVVWLTLISSAPGKQGYLSPAEAKGWKASTGAGSTALLLDPGAAPLPRDLPDGALAVLIGPEGGWDDAERAHAISHGARAYGLGSLVLRAETAPLAVLAALRHSRGWS